MSGSAEATNIILSIIALASVAQVALLVAGAVSVSRAMSAMRLEMDMMAGRLERMAAPALASTERAMDEVGRAAEAVQDAKQRADQAVQSAKLATTRAMAMASGPVMSAVAAAAGMTVGALRRRRHRRLMRSAAQVTH